MGPPRGARPGRRLLAIVTALTVAFAAAGVALSLARYDSARDRQVSDLTTTARANAADAGRFLADRLDLLTTASAGGGFAEADRLDIEQQLGRLAERHPEFDLGVAWVPPGGRDPVGSLRPGVVTAATRPAVEAAGSGAVLTFARNDPGAILLVAPTTEGAGRVVAAISTAWLSAFSRNLTLADGVRVFIVHEGALLAGPEGIDNSAEVRDDAFAAPVADARPAYGVDERTEGVVGDRDSLVAYGVVSIADWTIALERSDGAAFGDARRSVVLELVLLGAAAAVAVVGSALVARRLDRAADREHRISTTLQHHMLPAAVPSSGLAELSARYEPATTDMTIGGDWWDARTRADGALVLAVGDIVGRGLEAAAAVGQIRSQLTALVLDHADPAEVVSRLSRLAEDEPALCWSTVSCVVVAPDGSSATYANAGHPPPLIADDRGARWLDRGGPPLGAHFGEHTSTTVPLTRESTLVLYTDGLVERRGEVIDEGLDRLWRAVERHRAVPAAELADAVYDELVGTGPTSDDVALVVAQLRLPRTGREPVVLGGSAEGRVSVD